MLLNMHKWKKKKKTFKYSIVGCLPGGLVVKNLPAK